MAEVNLNMNLVLGFCKSGFDQNIGFYEQTLRAERELFLLTWQNEFPGVGIPQLDFSDQKEAESYLLACSTLVNVLERKLKQKKLYLRFLQV